jgi:SAM-dependent methyltransferase
MNLKKRIKATINFKFRFLKNSFDNKPFKLLDVGGGNHSASRIKSLFTHCEYYGLDVDRNYNYSEEDFRLMKDFYELDLTQLNYDIIPDHFFDGIWMAHVVEHLYNGDLVVAKLIEKLKPGGYFYIEYPGERSTKLPSMPGSLNFRDDPSHVRLYSVPELANVFRNHHCTVLKSGTRRNWFTVIGLPFI